MSKQALSDALDRLIDGMNQRRASAEGIDLAELDPEPWRKLADLANEIYIRILKDRENAQPL